jgi:2C-methyl-D-erythritol 2,4-cyclodiphosphate synthase
MQRVICDALNIREDRIGIKATTNEGLGEIGNKEAIASYAVVLITKENKGGLI